MVGLFTFGTLKFNGALGFFTFIFTCVLFTFVGVFTGEVDGGIQREKRVRCGDWRTYVDLVLPGVSVGVVEDMRHVESVKSRTIA